MKVSDLLKSRQANWEELERLCSRIEGSVRRKLDAATLASLQRGDVIELACQIGDPVTLCVEGQPVARAELVEVEGFVGARVRALMPPLLGAPSTDD